MSRLPAGLLAALLLAGAARAQDQKKDEKKADSQEVDAKTKAAIQREVEKAKQDIRDEVRAEVQGAQSAAEFLGAVAEGPKLQFFELDGYFRVRGQLTDGLDLRGMDARGMPLFPTSTGTATGESLATANMRLRLEPTLNVSEHVRVRAQIDVFDNYVLGSSTSNLFFDPASPYPVPFYGSSRAIAQDDPRADRPAIAPKRVWAEVQTPVGLLSFGRMPSEWALGILTNAGAGIDSDYGDTVDRLQFALPPVTTPIGRLTFVPILDFDAEGTLHEDPHFGGGIGQPFDVQKRDDGRTYAVKAARLDTEDEVRRKLDRNEKSVNYGAYYNYRTERFVSPDWLTQGYAATSSRLEHTASYGHFLDLWFRLLKGKWRVEAEAVGVYGNVGGAFALDPDPLYPTDPSKFVVRPLGRVLLRQWGGSIVTEYKAAPNKLSLGLEVGAASGDDAPGFGNAEAGLTPGSFQQVPWGSLDGPQFGRPGDGAIRNFRFNPAYRVDLVLFRHILGQVTDALYVKPKLHWDVFPGLAFDGALVYSRALRSRSTPSARYDLNAPDPKTAALTDEGDANLGIEADGILTYTSGDGFQAFGQWGVLQPLGGLEHEGSSLSRGHFLGFGLAAKF